MTKKTRQALNLFTPLLCAVTVAYVLTFPMQDPDTFWHLAYGRAMLTEGRFINHEIFSYTAAGSYLGSHSQLAQVLLYILWMIGGAAALLTFKLLVGLTTFFLLMRTARAFGLGRTSAAVLSLLVILSGMSRFVERPELFSILLQSLLILLLFGYRQGAYGVRVLWLLPVILVLWDYLHGALFGLILLVMFTSAETVKNWFAMKFRCGWGGMAPPLAHERLKPLWLWSGISVLSMSLHPNGLLNYSHFWRVSRYSADYAMYGEFMPTRFIPQFFWFWVCLGLVLLVAFLCLRRLDLTAIVVVSPFLYLALKYNRATLAFSVAAIPLLAHGLSIVSAQAAQRRWGRQGGLLLLFAILFAAPVYKEIYAPEFFRFGAGINANAFPVGSTRFIADVGLKGNMFNTDGAGGYLAFFLSPEQKIFHYNQPGVFTALTDYVHQPDRRGRWDIRYALVDDEKGYALFERQGFVPIYWEPNAMVLLKPDPGQAEFLEKYRIRYFAPLKSTAELEALSKKTRIGPRLCEELSIYLTYRRDLRIADLLGRLLHPANPDLQVPFELRRTWLEAALRQNQGNLNLLLSLGDLAYLQKDLDSAAVFFDQVLELAPANIEALLNRGYIEYDRQAFQGAAEYFSRAVKVDNGRSEPHYALGLAAMRLGDKGLMQREFTAFLQLVPEGEFADKARKFLASGP